MGWEQCDYCQYGEMCVEVLYCTFLERIFVDIPRYSDGSSSLVVAGRIQYTVQTQCTLKFTTTQFLGRQVEDLARLSYSSQSSHRDIQHFDIQYMIYLYKP